MRLLLIRHGETEHNVAGLLAGVTDSRLTNHGLIQAQRLGVYLARTRQLRFSHIFASDLQRALRTATQICEARNADHRGGPVDVICLKLLREQDFGSFELLPWNRTEDTRRQDPHPTDPNFKPKETGDAMKVRADTFLDDYLIPLLVLDEELDCSIAVVSHGLFLAALWKALLLRFKPSTISLNSEALPPSIKKPLEYLPSWSNTGFLDLEIKQLLDSQQSNGLNQPRFAESDGLPIMLDATMKVCAVNTKEHLLHLKRTRGGVGSSASDDKQRRLDTFFKKPKLDD